MSVWFKPNGIFGKFGSCDFEGLADIFYYIILVALLCNTNLSSTSNLGWYTLNDIDYELKL